MTTSIFPLRGNNSAHVTLLRGMSSKLRIGSTEAICCHWSNGFWLAPSWPPFFLEPGLDFQNVIPDLNLSELHRASGVTFPAVRRTCGIVSAKLVQQIELDFNNFMLTHVLRNKIVIFRPRFSFILDTARFLLQPRPSKFQ